ncbi:mitochondrial hydroxyacid-oxoacid transhydrogenase [Kickxella alabastrina]|uniref:mitochondrial hydroxyacid-oxoacid transhydrogenase n=1 Tax=Kickxella alabastrina TaxID=61397 RepID=UPI00221EAE31|nr:mitochondrial hydroxyacid-oxoacid transhydrogenase [Kickxella alabastrina]KAI7825460.1 mitochondrial hydroxyacid-oxoacid transhydrogenase [Kickxella alabastrina]
MATSTIRVGAGATREIGMDLANLRAKRVMVFTDPNIFKLAPLKTVVESLDRANVPHIVYKDVRVEPSDVSFQQAIDAARKYQPDAIVAVGGGSTIDTAKAANLYTVFGDAQLLDFVNAPLGKGRAVDRPLLPLIAVPTTAGTGSECTGSAIFDLKSKGAKTGIADRALKPLLGIIDPLNTRTMPQQVRLASGLDVLCHAIESYTAIPYHQRGPAPTNPLLRPAYQGSNPISDICQGAPRSVASADDLQAHEEMTLAAAYAGIGFGNGGVHLMHGCSYGISGLNKTYFHPEYPQDHPLCPHGISVAVTSPAVAEFTGALFPERHLEIAEVLGADITRARKEDAGAVLADALRKFLERLGVPNGIAAFGILPQHRVLKLSPRQVGAEQIAAILERSLKNY